MTKAEIVRALYTQVGGFTKKEAKQLVDLLFEVVTRRLAEGEPVSISGFGKFASRDKKSRPGRNPKTGDVIAIGERRVLTFRPSQLLKKALNMRTQYEEGASRMPGARRLASSTRFRHSA